MTDTIKPTAYRIDWPSEPELGHSLEDDPCGPELGRCEALYAGPDVAALVRQMRDALAECVDDSRAAVGQYVQSYGEHFRPTRLAGLRKIAADADAALAAADAFLAQHNPAPGGIQGK